MNDLSAVYRKARRHLSRHDPVMKRIMAGIGPCTLQLNPDRFAILARSIISQQISGKAARSISARLEGLLKPRGLTARGILKASDETLRSAGVSLNKARSLRDLAEKISGGHVPLEQLHELDDEAAIEELIVIRGIGRWTAQMFLMFSLGRLDVLPVDDLGFRVAIQKHYALVATPKKADLTQLAEPWRPYRSVATWYLWRSLGGVPQSK
jgi:DNA-3-methyladenine glycosylase II